MRVPGAERKERRRGGELARGGGRAHAARTCQYGPDLLVKDKGLVAIPKPAAQVLQGIYQRARVLLEIRSRDEHRRGVRKQDVAAFSNGLQGPVVVVLQRLVFELVAEHRVEAGEVPLLHRGAQDLLLRVVPLEARGLGLVRDPLEKRFCHLFVTLFPQALPRRNLEEPPAQERVAHLDQEPRQPDKVGAPLCLLLLVRLWD